MFKKINILDFALIILSISAILISVLKVNKRELTLIGEEEKTAYITLVALNAENESMNTFDKNEIISLSESGFELGKVIKTADHVLTYKLSPIYVFTDIASAEVDGIEIKIKAKVKVNEHGTYIDSHQFVAPGTKLLFNSNNNKNLIATVDSIFIL